MTGTGSGKTEAFLLPILGKLAREAQANPSAFLGPASGSRAHPLSDERAGERPVGPACVPSSAIRASSSFSRSWAAASATFCTLYEPHALCRHPDTRKGFRESCGPSTTFMWRFSARRTDPIPTNRSKRRDFAERTQGARESGPPNRICSPGSATRGASGRTGRPGNSAAPSRLPDDVELFTRHEVQAAPPDLLVTNYSMLEYMLMRPIERPIFDKTRDWLEQNPGEKFLIVLDEAHLYRGAAGAEVGLLLRRLRDRLNIPPERFQVICATASFKDAQYAPQFGAQLTGVPAETFHPDSRRLRLEAARSARAQNTMRKYLPPSTSRHSTSRRDRRRSRGPHRALSCITGMSRQRSAAGSQLVSRACRNSRRSAC